jgi:hypothetical protein
LKINKLLSHGPHEIVIRTDNQVFKAKFLVDGYHYIKRNVAPCGRFNRSKFTDKLCLTENTTNAEKLGLLAKKGRECLVFNEITLPSNDSDQITHKICNCGFVPINNLTVVTSGQLLYAPIWLPPKACENVKISTKSNTVQKTLIRSENLQIKFDFNNSKSRFFCSTTKGIFYKLPFCPHGYSANITVGNTCIGFSTDRHEFTNELTLFSFAYIPEISVIGDKNQCKFKDLTKRYFVNFTNNSIIITNVTDINEDTELYFRVFSPHKTFGGPLTNLTIPLSERATSIWIISINEDKNTCGWGKFYD